MSTPTAPALRDDPECDGTDAAHPAWWRGNEAGVEGAVREMSRVLSGECRPPFHYGSPALSALATALSTLRERQT